MQRNFEIKFYKFGKDDQTAIKHSKNFNIYKNSFKKEKNA